MEFDTTLDRRRFLAGMAAAVALLLPRNLKLIRGTA
jgi:hypothetical protein